MARIVSLTEAASIGFHGLVLIARSSENSMNVIEISKETGSSKHHVAKVFQRLVKTGFLDSQRGPKGGFSLTKDPKDITFLNIYEAIEGEIVEVECAMEHQICPFDKCIMNNVVKKMTRDFRDYLASQKLSDYLLS